jgi:hypothetical protein
MGLIGLNENEIKVRDEVYYYSFYDCETNENSEPIKSIVVYPPHLISNQLMVHLDNVSGAVCITHLSKEYFKEKLISNSKRKAKLRYKEYLRLRDALDCSFIQFLNSEYCKNL